MLYGVYILPFTAVRHVGPSSGTAIFHGILESMTKEQATTHVHDHSPLSVSLSIHGSFLGMCRRGAEYGSAAMSVHARFEVKPRRPPCRLSMHMAVGDMRAVPWWGQPRGACRAQCQAI